VDRNGAENRQRGGIDDVDVKVGEIGAIITE
jgi:hypothetical protein